MLKQEKAITLINLVITIILLLILAGVTLVTINGKGILTNVENVVDMSKVNAMKAEIEMQIAKTMMVNDREVALEEIIERLEKQEIIIESNVLLGQVKTHPDGYVYQIKELTNGNWEVIYLGNGEIEKIPLNGEIEIGSTADLEEWTNQDIVLEITWPENAEYYKRQVSIDGGITWNEYTENIEIEENTEVIAKVEDNAGNEMKKTTLEISKIDKERPTVEISPNGGTGYVMPIDANGVTGKAKIKTKLTATDEGGSELKTLQYAWNQSAETEPTSWTNFTNEQEVEKSDITTAGTWYLWTNVIDVAGNRATEIQTSEGFVVSANTEAEYIIKLTPDYTDWTANDITVTATYGTKLTPTSLRCTGTSGTDYTVNGTKSVVVKNNNQTVTATATDKAGNIITATITISKIDKNPPIVTATTEEVTITEDDDYGLSTYFTIEEDGDAPISSVVYTNTSADDAVVTSTADLEIGTHVIKCTVTKETGLEASTNKTIIVKKSSVSATEIAANPTAYYGGVVTNYTCTNSAGVNAWQIFYADSSNIYLVTDDYIHYNYVPKGKGGTAVTKVADYQFRYNSVYGDYSGNSSVTDSRIKQWYSFGSNYSSKSSISTCVAAYLLDINVWSGFKNSTYAEYAIGSPTIDLYTASYNEIHPNQKMSNSYNSYGDLVKWESSGSYSHSLSNLDTSNRIHIITDTDKSTGWRLASPSGGDSGYERALLVAGSGGSIGHSNYHMHGYGLRPIVCLKSTVELKKQADGTYIIK